MSADPDQWPVADYMIINKEKSQSNASIRSDSELIVR